MLRYKVVPKSGIDYVITCDDVVSNGEWLLFYRSYGHVLVHACSSHFTEYIALMKD
jgi:hypothetical protein